MQADAQSWILFRESYGFSTGRLTDHKTCAGQDPLLVRANDCPVDRAGAAKIIRIADLRLAGIVVPLRQSVKLITAHGKHVSGTGPKMWCSTSEGTSGDQP